MPLPIFLDNVLRLVNFLLNFLPIPPLVSLDNQSTSKLLCLICSCFHPSTTSEECTSHQTFPKVKLPLSGSPRNPPLCHPEDRRLLMRQWQLQDVVFAIQRQNVCRPHDSSLSLCFVVKSMARCFSRVWCVGFIWSHFSFLFNPTIHIRALTYVQYLREFQVPWVRPKKVAQNICIGNLVEHLCAMHIFSAKKRVLFFNRFPDIGFNSFIWRDWITKGSTYYSCLYLRVLQRTFYRHRALKTCTQTERTTGCASMWPFACWAVR